MWSLEAEWDERVVVGKEKVPSPLLGVSCTHSPSRHLPTITVIILLPSTLSQPPSSLSPG